MGTRQAFDVASLAEQTTTSATAVTKATLTFTPDASSDYFIIASANYTHSSGTDNHVGHAALYHVQSTTLLLDQMMQPRELTTPQDYVPFFGVARLSFGASPGAQDLQVQIWSDVSGDTTKIKDIRVLVIKADAADQYAASDAQASQSTTTYATKTTLTFTPGTTGDYLVIGSAELSSDVNLSATRGRLNYVTGSLTYGDKVWANLDDFDYQPFAVMEKLNLSNASKTFQLEYKANAAGTPAYIKNARIVALRLDKFDAAYFASDQTGGSTTAATDQIKMTLTATPRALQHAIIAVAQWNTASTSVSGYLDVAKAGTTINEAVREAPNTAGYLASGFGQRETLAAVSTDWTWRIRAETAGTTINVANMAIAVLQLDATPAAGRRRQMALAA
jgi:hypothetical protein